MGRIKLSKSRNLHYHVHYISLFILGCNFSHRGSAVQFIILYSLIGGEMWTGYWGKHMKAESFRIVKDYQKVRIYNDNYVSKDW